MLARPPLGPPRFAARAVNAAAVATARRPRTQRRPLVHALLVYANITANHPPIKSNLLRYSREVAQIYASHGIDIYLQSDVRTRAPSIASTRVPSRMLTLSSPSTQVNESHLHPTSTHSLPITLEHIDTIVNASATEFIILVTEQDVSRRTIQARVGAQFVERDVDNHASSVIEAWAAAISRQATPDELFSLGMNPNVVTNKHIDFFLQQHPLLRGIRSAYATLARLVDSTQKWLSNTVSDNAPPPFEALSNRSSPPVSALEGSVDSSNSNQVVGNNFLVIDSPASNKDTSSVAKDDWEEMARRALRKGLDVVAKHAKSDNLDSPADTVLNSPSSPTTMRWMKRSTHTRARLLRGQFLVRSLHSRLVRAYPTIATASIANPPKPNRTSDTMSVPSEAHRRRLLREVNFLVVRMEELGSRLSRRPRTRRRRRTSNHLNPWASYIRRFHGVNETCDTPADNAQNESREYYINLDEKEGWRCTECYSLNRRNASSCRSCGAPSSVLARGLLPDDTESMAKLIREAINTSAQQRRPWIFAPTPLPRPSVSPTGSGGGARGQTRRNDASQMYSINRIPGAPAETPRLPPVAVHNSLHNAGHQLSSPEQHHLVDVFHGLSVDDPSAHTSHSSRPGLYDIPVHSPPVEVHSGMMNGVPPHFSLPNETTGASRSTNVHAIPIGRPRNGRDRPPPARSPGARDFPGFPHRRIAEEHRPSSFDANLLGNSFGRQGTSRWFRDEGNGEDTAKTNAHFLGANGHTERIMGRSPSVFNSSNGFPVTHGSMFETRSQHKRSEFIDDFPRHSNHFAHTSRQPINPFSNGSSVHTQTIPHMEELAKDTFEARTYRSHPMFPPVEHRSSLEDLAAASDAANGGLGSATTESLRAVMAYRSEFQKNGERRNGGYGLF